MKFYSTADVKNKTDLRTAVLDSLPTDGGLYMPESIPQFDPSYFKEIESKTLLQMAFDIAKGYLSEDFSDTEIKDIVNNAVSFSAPVVHMNDQLSILELWHGPSLAFKDFGARFMAQVMSRLADSDKMLTILVATSGDTGGAVAAGFYGVKNVEVIVLYPKGKVSDFQEKQLTTLGGNITALEVDGTFDDCQALVKKAFWDNDLQANYQLTSANSINIARLMPQSFYYFDAYRQLKSKCSNLVFCVPSGNFGNIMAGLMAMKMGLPVKKFIAATNVNKVVPEYLQTGNFIPITSIATISNAMDVGNPSNFERIEALFDRKHELVSKEIDGYSFTDEETFEAIKEVKDKFNYTICPHGAVGYLGAKVHQESNKEDHITVLATAHPAKFLSVMNRVIKVEIDIPERLAVLADKEKESTAMKSEFSDLKKWLLARV